MKACKLLVLAGTSLWALAAHAQHEHEHRIEEIVVTATNKRPADTAIPVVLLTGEDLAREAGATLGETIDNTPGVQSSSYGAGVGQPVIRGLSGERVLVLQNSIESLDASGASPDHASSTEALLSDRIEILRGPATLLYGSGAIGGVVNVIDSRIPEALPTTRTGALELRGSSVDSGRAVLMRMDGSAGSIAWHLHGLHRDADDYDIPGWAIDSEALQALEQEHDEEGDEHDGETENSKGFVANSFSEAENLTAGASWIGSRGFLGFAFSRTDKRYGLPPGAHAAHGHAHDLDGADHEDNHDDEEAQQHDEAIYLDMEQERYDLAGRLELDGSFEDLRLQVSRSRYRHREIAGEMIGTVFDSDSLQARLSATHDGPGELSGVLGLQAGERDFSALGAEAFVPPSRIRQHGIFILESIDQGSFSHELGARLEQQRIATETGCERRDSNWATSAASNWHYHSERKLSLSLSRARRAPGVEELYSNVPSTDCVVASDPARWVEHAASARYELGNPALDVETADNIEIGWHKHAGEWQAEINLFHTRYADFIYLADAGEFEHRPVSRYQQADARFHGLEAQVTLPVEAAGRHLDLRFFGDYVAGELEGGDNVPRMAPARLGFEVAYPQPRWSARLRSSRVFEQNQVADNELPTDAYTRLDLFLDYHLSLGEEELLIFARGSNLLDEEIRDHTSLLRHYAPAPGRGLELGIRLRF